MTLYATGNLDLEWIKGHSENGKWNSLEELISQDLSSQQVYNVWCDHMANAEWETGSPPFPDPEVSPYEKWAIFSIHPESHKIIGKFNTNIHSCISFQSSVQYNSQKHQLNHAKLICPPSLPSRSTNFYTCIDSKLNTQMDSHLRLIT